MQELYKGRPANILGAMTTRQFLSDYSGLLILIAAFPLSIAGSVYVMVRKMSAPENMLFLLPGPLGPRKEMELAKHREWLQANHFQQVSSFRFGKIETVTFKQEEAQRFLTFYFYTRVTFSFESCFDDADCVCLETSMSGSVGMFPQRPNQYQQSFPGMSLENLWKRHLEAEEYVVKKFNFKWKPLTLPFEELLFKDTRLRMDFVRSIPFYPFRAIYWYFVTRKTMANRSIQQQFP